MSSSSFETAIHTIVVSDIHLSDAEPPHPGNPLWKRFKRPKLFTDRSFEHWLEALQQEIKEPIELVLNGDILDFDSVMVIPSDSSFHISWLERRRGLFSEEEKSLFKLRVILTDHFVWVRAIRSFLLAGNRLVFVIGNHDMELHWPSLQAEFLNRLDLPEDHRANVRFCEWFYVSNKDTLIEHGNQHDAYCLCSDPVHPLIRKGSHIFVRLPFGNLAGKYIVNGMGFFNPHVETSFIMSLKGYIIFFYRYVMRTQPLILWTWLWGAMTTLLYSVTEGLLPALKDPLTVDSRVEAIAGRSNTTPSVVRTLREVHVHPAIFNPFMIMRELWLDRAFGFALVIFLSFEFFSIINVFIAVSFWFFVIPMTLLMPVFIYYARSVSSDVFKVQKAAIDAIPLLARISGVSRVVFGHTHREIHTNVGGIDTLNTGTWSPAYRDVECTKPVGRKCFAWVKPGPTGSRVADLYEWKDPGFEKIAPVPHES